MNIDTTRNVFKASQIQPGIQLNSTLSIGDSQGSAAAADFKDVAAGAYTRIARQRPILGDLCALQIVGAGCVERR